MADAGFLFDVKFKKEAGTIQLPGDATLENLKHALEQRFAVPASRQKLVGVKKCSVDSTPLAELGVKQRQKIMLIGTRDDELVRDATEAEKARLEAMPDAATPTGTVRVPVHKQEANWAKIEKRVRTYQPRDVAGFRPGKRVVVLDVDYTLFDHRSVVQSPGEQSRPFVHDFLAMIYPHWDICIWSASSMRAIGVKLASIGVLNDNPDCPYRIATILDHGAMIPVESAKYGGVVNTKPLGVLWGLYPENVKPENSLMVDDVRRNFLMNPKVCG